MSEPPARPGRSPLLGVVAVVVAAAAILNFFLPVVWPLAVLAALTLGIVAVARGDGRWPGVAALALVGALILAIIGSGFGFTVNLRQQALLARAASITPPAGLQLADGPMGLGWCGTFAVVCDQAEVVWSYRPTQSRTEAADLCAPFLDWAAAQGVPTVFVVPAAEWRSWYDEYADSLYGKGGAQTYPVGSDEALAACIDMVEAAPGAEAPIADRRYLVGTTSSEGAGDIFVARIGPAESVPDRSTVAGGDPFMIVGSLHGR